MLPDHDYNGYTTLYSAGTALWAMKGINQASVPIACNKACHPVKCDGMAFVITAVGFTYLKCLHLIV